MNMDEVSWNSVFTDKYDHHNTPNGFTMIEIWLLWFNIDIKWNFVYKYEHNNIGNY